MKEKEMGEIPELKGVKGLPVTFKLLTKVAVNETPKKNLFFYVTAYQGMALAEAFEKPYSKIIN
ncbi:hypothetical protein [Runella sp. SP2]|uniref:hypothetical protein n=1 Tax=Runella sp. SP2 TaxID=2268026 RepID=UPI000F07AB9A|nr:hypothetical protein [Runella sp. SP2]AYQ34385.1 hypothetical protein DTQ70_20460 [Runella sp. SP2]